MSTGSNSTISPLKKCEARGKSRRRDAILRALERVGLSIEYRYLAGFVVPFLSRVRQ
jgi:hypothetical protein